MSNTKQAHYIPETYSKNFCTEGKSPNTGFLYRKSDPEFVKSVQPKDWGKEKYYTAFTTEDGARDAQKMEGIYGVSEANWPKLIERFQDKKDLSTEEAADFFTLLV